MDGNKNSVTDDNIQKIQVRGKSKIDMTHGFMKRIIQNQFDRDNYDKEIKMMTENLKSRSSGRDKKKHQKSKKPDVPVYQPRKNQTSNSLSNSESHTAAERGNKRHLKHPLFKVEYEDEYGFKHDLTIYEGENLRDLSQRFGSKIGLSPMLIDALHYLLLQEYSSFKT